MSNDDQQLDDNNNNDETQVVDDKDAVIKQLKQEQESMRSKMQELLNETKQAKQRAKEEEEKAEREKAAKSGDYEKLLKSSEEKRQAAEEQLQKLQESVGSEKVKSESLKLASELADGPNAEILSEFIARRVKYTDDGLQVLDDKGNPTVSGVDDLKKEFANSERYKSLLRGNQSTGGGAAGDGKSGAQDKAKQMSRTDFADKTPQEQMQFIKDGGTLTDDN